VPLQRFRDSITLIFSFVIIIIIIIIIIDNAVKQSDVSLISFFFIVNPLQMLRVQSAFCVFVGVGVRAISPAPHFLTRESQEATPAQ